LTAVTNEIAAASGVGITLQEELIPVGQATRSVCDILGLDPLIMASEGRFLAVVPDEFSDRALELLRRQPGCPGARRIGSVSAQHAGQVVLETTIGGHRILNLAEGEPLPRIC
jgi:hydrogenase expression/formation protein HypE